ncbi:hypothetical protein J6590_019437 [Homalodisca vitripennis]|nr:hypothetical protein J6590_019437 [Homalodisca vitripennis]
MVWVERGTADDDVVPATYSSTPTHHFLQHKQQVWMPTDCWTKCVTAEHLTLDTVNDQLNNSAIGVIQEKLLNVHNLEETDLETSLSLAAEVGNALLTENQKLKQDLLDMTLKNTKLTQDFEELKTYSEINYQSQIEELENDREKLLNKYNKLVENLTCIENQLEKEKEIRMDLTKLFEEQDKEKEETICKLLNEVKSLTQFKTNRTSQDREPKTLKDMETQTSNTETPDISPKSLIFVELVHIKRRQDQAEEFMKTIQAQLQYTTSYPNCPSNSISQNCSANDDKAAKYAAGNNTSLTKSNLTPLTLEKKPPITAIIRPDNESIEEFFMKNIDFFKRINQNFLNKPITLHRTHDMASATSQATSVTPPTELDQHHVTAETEIHRSNPFLDHKGADNMEVEHQPSCSVITSKQPVVAVRKGAKRLSMLETDETRDMSTLQLQRAVLLQQMELQKIQIEK